MVSRCVQHLTSFLPGTDSKHSDYDRTGASTGYTGSGNYGSGTTGGSGVTGSGGVVSSGSTTSGPHSSNVENKLDPRVDSGKFHDLNSKYLGAV